MRSNKIDCPLCGNIGYLTIEKPRKRVQDQKLRKLWEKYRKKYPKLSVYELKRKITYLEPFRNRPHKDYESVHRKPSPYYKVVHNVKTKNGDWKTKKCYFGVRAKAFLIFQRAVEYNPGLLESKSVRDLLDSTPRDDSQKDIEIAFFKSEKQRLERHLQNVDKSATTNMLCPHCKEPVKIDVDVDYHVSLKSLK